MKNNLVNIFLMIGLALTACESNRVYDSIENKAPVIAEKRAATTQPNIVLIVTDDQAVSTMPAMPVSARNYFLRIARIIQNKFPYCKQIFVFSRCYSGYAEVNGIADLATSGIVARTGSGTFAGRTNTGTASEITVTNGDGVSGNPTFSLPDVYKIVDIHAGAFFTGAGDLTGTIFGTDADNTNDFSADYLEFSASADNYISVVVNMPPDWDASTAPKFKIISYSTGSHASQTAAWDIACGYVRPGTDSWIAALGSAVEATQTYTSANVWQLSSALAPTPAGTAAAGAQIKVRLFREGTDGTNDTFTSTSRLVKLQMQYKKTVYGDTVSW